ncbi:MAG: hypothetical protein V4556_01670 [Bacteroidota bacterium]
MSLNNIELDAGTLYGLYKNSIIESIQKSPKKGLSAKISLSFLGNNSKRIAIVVSSDQAMHLPDEELNFLLGILSACKLSMDDVAIINLKKNNGTTYQLITSELKAGTVLLFGVTATQIEMPIEFPHYQLQKFNNQLYLSAPLLHKLQNDKAEKIMLWNCLKQVFSII